MRRDRHNPPDGTPRPAGEPGGDAERSLVTALRFALVPSGCLPGALALLAASTAGVGPPIPVAAPILVLVAIAAAACWRKAIRLFRQLPRSDDDDHGWPRRWWGGGPQLDPSGGPGGIGFDWSRFEREFWSHVARLEHEAARARELTRALRQPLKPGRLAAQGLPRLRDVRLGRAVLAHG